MKEGWEYKKIEDCCDILDSYRKPITKSKRVKGVIPYYGATGLLDYVKDYIFDESLVLLGEDGAKWGAGEASAYEISGKTWVNNHAHVLRPHKDKIVNTWLIYYLNYENLSPYIKGITVPKLNQRSMCSIVIPVPPLSEQQRIVSYLDAAFAKIDAVAKNAEDALNEAKALFQSALTKMMEPKEGWEEKHLDEVAENCDSKRIPVKLGKRKGGEYPYYGASGIVDYVEDYIFDGDFLLISEDGANLLARVTPIAFSVTGKFWVNNHAHILKFNDVITQQFVEFYFKSINIKEYVTGAAQPKLTQRNLNKIPIYIPSLKEQQSVVCELQKLENITQQLQSNLTLTLSECAALKQSILRQTFE